MKIVSKNKKKKEKISVEEIPANVMETVDKVMPGGTIERAGKLEIKDKVIYKVKKAVEAGKYVIKVTADGALLAVLREDVYKRMRKRHGHGRHGHGKGVHEHHGHDKDSHEHHGHDKDSHEHHGHDKDSHEHHGHDKDAHKHHGGYRKGGKKKDKGA